MSLIIFIYGITLGSFLNVCIYRIPNNESILRPPSHCGRCNKKLGWKDLIPIFSYIIIKGRCRYCNDSIPIRYPIVEFLTGILLVCIYIRYGLTFNFFKYVVLTLFLIIIAFIDYDTMYVYSCIVYTGIIVGIVFIIFDVLIYDSNLLNYVLGAFLGFIVMGTIYALTGGIGLGDVEIAMLCGLYIGWKLEIYFIILSFIIGGVIGSIMIFTRKKLKSDYIPLGPSLAVGAYFSLIIGENLISIFMGI